MKLESTRSKLSKLAKDHVSIVRVVNIELYPVVLHVILVRVGQNPLLTKLIVYLQPALRDTAVILAKYVQEGHIHLVGKSVLHVRHVPRVNFKI